jgi:hypothetical protein
MKGIFYEFAKRDIFWVLVALIVVVIISLGGELAGYEWPASSEIPNSPGATPVTLEEIR